MCFEDAFIKKTISLHKRHLRFVTVSYSILDLAQGIRRVCPKVQRCQPASHDDPQGPEPPIRKISLLFFAVHIFPK